MKKKIILAVSALSVAAVIGLTSSKLGVVSADPYYSTEDIRNQVSKLYPGEITELEFEKKGNQYIYEVEIELDGKEYELKIDGDTGEVLKLEEGFAKVKQDENNIVVNHNQEVKNDDAKTDEKPVKVEKTEEKSTNNTSTPPSSKTAELPRVDNGSNNTTTNKTTEETVKKNTLNSKTVIGISEAKRIALTHFNGTVVEIELDDDDNRLIYEIEMKNNGREAEIEIDAYTGQLLVLEIERDDDYKSNKTATKTVIGIEKAKSIALNQFSGKIEDIELDDDDNRLIYKVEIENGDREAEIEIDAYTGKVLDVDIDD